MSPALTPQMPYFEMLSANSRADNPGTPTATDTARQQPSPLKKVAPGRYGWGWGGSAAVVLLMFVPSIQAAELYRIGAGVTSECGVEGHARHGYIVGLPVTCGAARSQRPGQPAEIVPEAIAQPAAPAGIKPGHSLVTPALIYTASAGVDYASTRYALNAGAREAHPLLRSHLEAWKLAQVAALLAVDLELQKRGYRNKARVLRITAAVVGAGLAVHNLSVARRQK